MSDEWMDRLSDYLDGDMSPAERVLFEARLAEDEGLAAALDSLRRVVNRAQTLDDPVPASARNIWSAVAERIGATPPREVRRPERISDWRSTRFAISIPQLVAAGIALVLLAGGGSWLIRGPSFDSAPSPASRTDVNPQPRAQAVFVSAGAARFDQAVADLVQVLDKEREFLNPETVRIVEENLAIIDRAITRARQALTDDPESEYLRRHLERTMRQKLTLLQEITMISSAL